LCIKPPVLIHGSNSLIKESNENLSNEKNAVILSDVDEIGEYLDKLFANGRYFNKKRYSL
jgi:hypothetical protein